MYLNGEKAAEAKDDILKKGIAVFHCTAAQNSMSVQSMIFPFI
jgi:hypothetical protein